MPLDSQDMSSRALVRTLTDPDELQNRYWDSEHTITQRGVYTAKFHFISLPKLWVHHYSHSLARVNHTNIRPDRIGFTLRTAPGPALVRYGIEFSSTDLIMVAKPADSFFQTSLGPASHGGLHFLVDDFNALSETMLGRDPKTVLNVYKPAPDAMARLQRLHVTARTLADEVPEVLANPEAARSLDAALIEALLKCLAADDATEDRAALRRHDAIMRRFRRVIERSSDQPLYIPDVCQEIGTSLRTLDACCHEYLGMPPKHYLLLRRMNMARRALGYAASSETTVTEVATRYGFWELGRFAVAYRALFGESPSRTLTRRLIG